MSSAAPARDAVGLLTIAVFGLCLGFIGLRGLHQGHFDHVVTWQAQPLGFALRFVGWMLGGGFCLWGAWSLWRRTLAPDARLWQDTAPLPREQPPRLQLHERPRGVGRRLAGLAALLACGASVALMHATLEPVLGRARWMITGLPMLFVLVGLLRWPVWRPHRGPLLVLGPEGLQDLRRGRPPIAWADIQEVQLAGARLFVALHAARRTAVLKRRGAGARWTALAIRWDGDGADVAVSLQGLDGRPTAVLALARAWMGWAGANPPPQPGPAAAP